MKEDTLKNSDISNEPIIAESQPENEILSSRSFTWDAIRRGDCLIEPGGTFTLYEDGSSNWRCDISSRDSNDHWEGEFRFMSAGNSILAQTGRYAFNLGSEKNKKRRWDENRRAEERFARIYNEVHHMEFNCKC